MLPPHPSADCVGSLPLPQGEREITRPLARRASPVHREVMTKPLSSEPKEASGT